MAIHEFVCDGCNVVVEDTNTKKIHHCPKCGEEMRWDLHGIGIQQGDYELISHSLAIHPGQIAEHRQLFPNVEVISSGPDAGCPRFTSPKQQERYANACGFDKKPQRNRKRGKRIA